MRSFKVHLLSVIHLVKKMLIFVKIRKEKTCLKNLCRNLSYKRLNKILSKKFSSKIQLYFKTRKIF